MKSHCPARLCHTHTQVLTSAHATACIPAPVTPQLTSQVTNVTHTQKTSSHTLRASQICLLMNNIGKHTCLSDALTSQPFAFISPLLPWFMTEKTHTYTYTQTPTAVANVLHLLQHVPGRLSTVHHVLSPSPTSSSPSLCLGVSTGLTLPHGSELL